MKPLTKKQEKENARAEAIATLRRLGIRCYLPTIETGTDLKTDKKTRKPSITNITRLVSIACDIRLANGYNWDLVVGGCGMDMCFHTVYNLAHAMFPGQERAGYMLNARDL